MSVARRSAPFFLYVLLVFLSILPLLFGAYSAFLKTSPNPAEPSGPYWFLTLLMLFMMSIILYKSAKFLGEEVPNWKHEWNYILGNDLLTRAQIAILGEYQPYYKSLEARHRKEFEKRVAVFCSRKEFKAKGDIAQITDQHRILIGACAAQLTFGLPELSFPRIRRIFLYQSEFFNPFTKAKHKGETNSKGRMVFSWKHFLEGYAYPNDAINLGLHEMAHALRIENRTDHDGEHLFIPTKLWREWDKIAIPVYYAIQRGEHTFLRKYAGANEEEFFAVCVEHFFEKPLEFQKELPVLYHILCKILNQNPAKRIVRGY